MGQVNPMLGRGATDEELDAYWGDDEPEEVEPDWEQIVADREADAAERELERLDRIW